MASVMGEKAWAKKRRIRQNPAMSQQQAIEKLGLRNLSPTSKALVIKGRAPRSYRGSYENYVANMHKAYLEKTEAVEKIQAAFRNPDQFRKKVRKMKKLNQLEKKALKLAQRRNLLQEEDRIRGELNAMSPNSPSPPRGRSYNNNPVYTKKMLELRARANPGFGARASRKITQLYTNGRAKSIRDKKRLYKKKMMKIATKKPPKRKRPRQAQKPRKKKKPTLAPAARMKAFNKKMTSKLPKIRTTNSPSPTIAQIQRNLLKKRYTLTDLITGKIKTFTKKGWYDRAIAKQQILRMRICA